MITMGLVAHSVMTLPNYVVIGIPVLSALYTPKNVKARVPVAGSRDAAGGISTSRPRARQEVVSHNILPYPPPHSSHSSTWACFSWRALRPRLPPIPLPRSVTAAAPPASLASPALSRSAPRRPQGQYCIHLTVLAGVMELVLGERQKRRHREHVGEHAPGALMALPRTVGK